MQRKINLICRYISVLLVSGCGSGDQPNTSAGDGGASTEGIPLDEFRETTLDLMCGNATSCHWNESTADCRAIAEKTIAELEALVAAGKAKYNAEKAQACLDGMPTNFMSCSWTEQSPAGGPTVPAACEEVFVGTKTEGQACYTDLECVSGECEKSDDQATRCDVGACGKKEPTTTAKIGESCQAVDCEAGAYCQLDTMGAPTTCAAHADEGEPCSSFDGCKPPNVCGIDLNFDNGLCERPAAHGAACDPYQLLACDRWDDYCDAATKVCTLRKLPGEACDTLTPCVIYAECGASGECVKAGTVGSACDGANDPSCTGDLQCMAGKCAWETCP